MRAVRVKIPATTANLGPGFDTVGMSLDLCNEICVAEDIDTVVRVNGEGSESLPQDASNLVYRSMEKAAISVGRRLPRLRIECTNRIPLSRGMGSSAAAIAGGLVAANALLSLDLDCERILNLAVQLEGHPDNVSPALFGGLVVSCLGDHQEARCIRMSAPKRLIAVLAIPDFHLSTSKARAVLPKTVSREDAVFNISRAALLVAALQHDRYDLLTTAMSDRLHQPYRAPLVPGLSEVLQAAVNAGASGASMSGAGPTVIAFCADSVGTRPELVADAMAQAFEEAGVTCSIAVARPADAGALATVEHLPTWP